jgi:hypothetical protein
MCFTVDKRAKAPRTAIVYKVVRNTSIPGKFLSVPRYAPYETGKVFESDVQVGVRWKGKTKDGNSANCGMYVYLNKEGAIQAKSSIRKEVVIALRVHPKSFLCLQSIGDCGENPVYRKATYRRGRVLGVVA